MVLAISTLQDAPWAMELGTDPIKRWVPCIPFDPTTIRSAPTSSATSIKASAGAPLAARVSSFAPSAPSAACANTAFAASWTARDITGSPRTAIDEPTWATGAPDGEALTAWTR